MKVYIKSLFLYRFFNVLFTLICLNLHQNDLIYTLVNKSSPFILRHINRQLGNELNTMLNL